MDSAGGPACRHPRRDFRPCSLRPSRGCAAGARGARAGSRPVRARRPASSQTRRGSGPGGRSRRDGGVGDRRQLGLCDERDRAGAGRPLVYRGHSRRAYYFILSVEALAGLSTWHEPARLLELARLAVVQRPGAPLPNHTQLGGMLPGGAASIARVECVDTVPLAHSSSDVRARAISGRSIRYLVPPAVEAYIRDHRLYRSDTQTRTA